VLSGGPGEVVRADPLRIVLVAGGVAGGGAAALAGRFGGAIVNFVCVAGAGALASPALLAPSVSAAQAQALPSRPIIYWRFWSLRCIALRISLGVAAGRVYWVDISTDGEGAAIVHALARGVEAVPVVVIPGHDPVVQPPLRQARSWIVS
jgi:mycoredoxin